MLIKSVHKDAITIYNYYKNPENGNETYKRTVINDVYWNEDSVSIFKKTGTVIADNVTLYIPYSHNYRTAKEFNQILANDINNCWTVEAGADRRPSYILKFECPFEFGWGVGDDFLKQYIRLFENEYKGQYKRVKDVNERLIGSKHMWHITVRM